MIQEIENIANVDLDSTLADYHGQITRDLLSLKSPEEPDIDYFAEENVPEYLENRVNLIRRIPGWWRNLPRIEENFSILEKLRELGYSLNILTKGPRKIPSAWAEKVEWSQENVPDASITLTQDKGLVYGKILVDDWPEYIYRWLKWRPRGLVIMPAQPWNLTVNHPNVFRYHGYQDDTMLRDLLLKVKNRRYCK